MKTHLKIESTPKTPKIEFVGNTLLITGRSIPDNGVEFYHPLVEAIKTYAQSPEETTVVKVGFQYFNTISAKRMLDIFKQFEQIKKDGRNVVVEWFFEKYDDDMMEAGEDYQAIINLPFKMVEQEELQVV